MGLFKKIFGGDEGTREAMNETYHRFRKEITQQATPELAHLTALFDTETILLTYVIQARYPREWGFGDCLLIAHLFPHIETLTEWVVEFERSSYFRARDYRAHLMSLLAAGRIRGDQMENAEQAIAKLSGETR